MTDTDGRGYSGSVTGSACGREVVAASGGGDTESSAADRKQQMLRPTVSNRCCGHSFRDNNNDSGNHRDSDPSDETRTGWCVSPVGSRVMQQHDARTWTSRFRLCSQDGGRRKLRGFIMIPPQVAMDRRGGGGGKWRLIREEGLASRGQ